MTLSLLRKIDLLRLAVEFKRPSHGMVQELKDDLRKYLNAHCETLYKNPWFRPLYPKFQRPTMPARPQAPSGPAPPIHSHHLVHQIRPTPRTNPLSHGTGLKSPQNTMTLLNFRWYPLRTHQSTTIHLHLHLHHLLSLAQNQNPFLLLITTMNPVSIFFLLPPLILRLCPSPPCIIYIPYPLPLRDFLLVYPRSIARVTRLWPLPPPNF